MGSPVPLPGRVLMARSATAAVLTAPARIVPRPEREKDWPGWLTAQALGQGLA
jgi:hypothetical protein